jgi:hypothetical protein
VPTPGSRGNAIIDIFRLENGKVVRALGCTAGNPGAGRQFQYDVLDREMDLELVHHDH